MAILAGVAYDPGTAVSKSCASLLAMTALDTTNLRVTFTAPANGKVLVRMRGTFQGSVGTPMVLFGVLDGATVTARAAPIGMKTGGFGGAHQTREAVFVVTGLTPSQSYTWDAAYGVEAVSASTALKYGGPDTNGTGVKFGAFVFEVWEASNLLAGKLYDPGTAAALSVGTSSAMTAMDTTNLRLTFTAPSTGNVLVRLRGVVSGATGTNPAVLLGVLDGATVKGRCASGMGQSQLAAAAASDHLMMDGEFIVTGLTASQSYTWDAAYSVDQVLAGASIKYGGPDNTTGDDAWGGFAYEIWSS